MKTFNLKTIGLGIAMIAFVSSNAQIKTPQPSPYAEIEQAIGLNNVEVTYSRPGVKKRTIFGDLVPYGKLWRTGANRATTFETDGELTIGEKTLKKGKYSVFTIPNEKSWIVIFNKNATASTGKYSEEDDALRIEVKSLKTADLVETFTIQFTDLTSNSANLQIMWENQKINIPVRTNADEQVMTSIQTVMNGPSSRDYYLAARYYYENEKEIGQAVEWINKSVEMDGEKPKFWVVHVQAQILAKSGDKKGAMTAAEESMQLAKEAEYDEYVKKNQALMDSLK